MLSLGARNTRALFFRASAASSSAPRRSVLARPARWV